MTTGISIREFARRDGCNDKLVRRAIEKKKLAPLEDGTLDPKLVGTGWRKQNRKSAGADSGADKSADTAKTVRTVTKVGRQQVERPPPADPAPLEEEEAKARQFVELVLNGEFFTTGEAEKIKENALALKHILDGRKKAGELIDAAVAEAVLFEEARASRDAWLNFPTRIGPLLAAQLGLEPERVVEALTDHVHQQLNDLGEPEADFRPGDGPAKAVVAEGVDAAAPH